MMNKSSRHVGILSVFALVLVMAALHGTGALASQVSQAWFDSHHGLMAVGVVTDGNGNLYVAGQDYLDASYQGSDDLVLIKYNLAGNRVWMRKSPNGGVPQWITLDPSGNILVTGSGYPAGTYFITWKFDPNGNLLWEHRDTQFGSGVRVATDSFGNAYVSGSTQGTGPSVNYYTYKIDPNGKKLWTRTYNGPSNWRDTVSSLAVRPGGRVAVTGSSEESIVTIVYDTNGNELWRRQFSSPDPSFILTGSDVAFGSVGEVYVGGNFLIKYDSSGNLVWVRPDPATNPRGGAIYRLKLDPQGNIIVIGDFESAAVLKYSPDGTKIWAQPFTDKNNNPGGLGVHTIGSDGSAYVTGTSQGGMLTVKYDANGNVQWKTDIFDHTFFGLDAGNAVALDSEGNVVVAGQSPILTVRYLQAGSPAPTPTAVPPTPTPVPSLNLHSGDLDGSSAPSGSRYWKATVRVTVHDANENPISSVTVSGTWSGGFSGSGSCTTSIDGTCSVTSGNIRNTRTSATFKITNLVKSGYTYSAAANHDPDGDSNGTQITINKP